MKICELELLNVHLVAIKHRRGQFWNLVANYAHAANKAAAKELGFKKFHGILFGG
jgi:hypothetical protein